MFFSSVIPLQALYQPLWRMVELGVPAGKLERLLETKSLPTLTTPRSIINAYCVHKKHTFLVQEICQVGASTPRGPTSVAALVTPVLFVLSAIQSHHLGTVAKLRLPPSQSSRGDWDACLWVNSS